MSVPMEEGSLSTEATDEACSSQVLTTSRKRPNTGDLDEITERRLHSAGVLELPRPRHQEPYPTVYQQGALNRQMRPGEDDEFLKFHKASLKRRIEQCGESITKAASQTNHRIITKYAAEVKVLFSLFEEKFNSVSCNDIFKAHGVVRTVMTQGAAGIGKTSSVHKFILDWADGKENKDVDVVFMFPFWKLNLVKDISCSLHKLLVNFHPEFDNLAAIKRFDDSRIVVIFDGLDESQLHLDFQNNQMLCDISEISSVGTIITNIIKGNLLPFAKVWITSHGSSTNQVPSWYINRVTEMLPLSDSQMEEFVKESLNDVTDASNILLRIKLSRSLHAMCHTPALCSIAVSVVKNMLEQGENRIQTCTELYSHFVISQMNTEAEVKSSSVQIEGEKMVDGDPQRTSREIMLRFSELALRQLMKNSFTFFEQDLRDFEINISETSIFRVFIESNQDKSEFFQENVFRFKHMGIQEFLAAICVFYAYNNKNMDILRLLLGGKFRIQPEDVSLDTLLRSAVDKMLERKNGHQYFLRFLHGMSLESSQMLLQSLLTDSCDRSGTTESTLKYIKDLGKQADVSMDKCIDLLHCQIEMQDPSVIEDIESLLKSQREFSLSHWSEISTLIQMSGGILGEFNHQKCHPSERKTVLSMFVSCCRKAQLSNCGLSVDSCVMVASVLQQPHSALRELDMSGNHLGTTGVEQLCSGLKSPNCKLEILRISNCGLSVDSCVMVTSVLQQPHSALRELDMSGNRLWDFGVKQLCSGLKSPNCKLEILRLSNCGLSESSCVMVASALQQPHSPLRELDMSGNHLWDFGVEQLCSGLKSPNCKLEILRLSNCGLSVDSCVMVASVLQQPHSALRELDMSGNHLGTTGVEQLCSGLKSPNCKLEILRISNCGLSVDSCVMVTSVLQQPHSALRELDMSGNRLWDFGVKQLCSGLKSPNCKLEILRLSNCGLSESSCVMVASALQQPHSPLRELDMSGNHLWDFGVEQLCSGLKSPNCKLEILRLSRCHLSNANCWILKYALGSDHSCLKELDVSNNFLDKSGVNLLKERLEDPKCKLESRKTKPTLDLFELPFQEEAPSDLIGVLSIDSQDYDGGGDDDESDTESSENLYPSGALLPHISIPPQPTRHFLGHPPSEGKGEDVFNAESGECKGNVEVFTPETSASSERTTYRFSCSSAGVYQCRYTGLIFKTDTAAEVRYDTVPWDYKKLEQEGLVAAGPLFKMKGLQGTVSQLGFPHCQIISSDEAPPLTVIHKTDTMFEILQPLKTSDTHVFLNITGFCKFGLAKKRCRREDIQNQIRSLVILFLNKYKLSVLLLPRNVVLREVCENRRKMPEQSKEIYIPTTSKCKLILDEEYHLTCSSQKHRINPKYGNA
ncbi:uncharacterized protein LOC143125341 isoform X2 [Alosa pseudoharengus]|uniref:uncharacterized protein LOC143125341 isoform X2 n=1 Tax=Alosa pseudoharengus TaxID=34774 RepID=UPI003F8949EF